MSNSALSVSAGARRVTHPNAWLLARIYHRYNRQAADVLGAAVVVLCLLLPFVLNAVTYQVESAEIHDYLQAAKTPLAAQAVKETILTTSTPQSQSSPVNDHFYFVNGCVANPGDCTKNNPGNWPEYYAELRRLYGTWPKDPSAGRLPFDDWARNHVIFLSAFSAETGAYDFRRAIEADTRARAIHALGTSSGGAALTSYLSKSMRGEFALDARIRDVMTVDAPLGWQPPLRSGSLWYALEAGAMRNDLWPGFGQWAREMGISVFLVDSPNDLVGHDEVPGVEEDASAVYPESDTPPPPRLPTGCPHIFCGFANPIDDILARSRWHDYTGGHASVSALQFMDEHWR